MLVPTPMREADEGSIRYAGWRVVGACFVMATLCWGLGFYGHGFYLAELRRIYGWPAALTAGATTLYYLLGAMVVVFVSDAVRRLGAAACVLTGAAALALAVTALAFVREPWQLYAAYAVMAVAWATLSLGAITNILGLWFAHKRGLAISLALNGASFGGVVIVPALVFLAAAIGFQATMLAAAALVLAVLVPVALTILRMPPPRAPAGDAGPGRPVATPAWTRRRALASGAFWSVSGFSAISLFSQAGFLVHQIAFLEPAVGRHTAGIAVAVMTAMAIAGRLVLGARAHRLDQRRAAAASLAAQAAALAVMTQTTEASLLLAASAVYGFSVGNLITFPSLIIQREFEAASFGLLVGLQTAISQFTYAFAPGLLGLVRDLTGGYGAALAICIALNLAAAAIVLTGPRGQVAGQGTGA